MIALLGVGHSAVLGLLGTLPQGVPVLVCLDQDSAGKAGAAKLACALVERGRTVSVVVDRDGYASAKRVVRELGARCGPAPKWPLERPLTGREAWPLEGPLSKGHLPEATVALGELAHAKAAHPLVAQEIARLAARATSPLAEEETHRLWGAIVHVAIVDGWVAMGIARGVNWRGEKDLGALLAKGRPVTL